MNRGYYMITNNPLVITSTYRDIEIVPVKTLGILEVLTIVRDHLHLGHRLISHPLSGSLKPNENPYKSVLISCKRDTYNFNEITLVEQCIASAEKFINGKALPKYNVQKESDFMSVDQLLIESRLNSGGAKCV